MLLGKKRLVGVRQGDGSEIKMQPCGVGRSAGRVHLCFFPPFDAVPVLSFTGNLRERPPELLQDLLWLILDCHHVICRGRQLGT